MAEPSLDMQALSALVTYDFPGNIRELKNMIEHALIKSHGATIELEHLYFIEMQATPTPAIPQIHSPDSATDTMQSIDPVENEARVLAHIRRHGSITNEQCRALLGAEYNQVSYLLKKMARTGILVRIGERRGASYRLA